MKSKNYRCSNKVMLNIALAFIIPFMGIGMMNVSAQTLEPPKTPPTSLPPIPKDKVIIDIIPPLPKDTGDMMGNISADNLPKNDFDEGRLIDLLKQETRRIEQAIAPEFNVVLLKTDDENFKQYVANGILKMSTEDYSRQEHGLSAMMVTNGRLNGNSTPVCYVLLEPKKAQHIWDGFISPLAQVSHPNSGAAWLVGHEVGHCIDQLERNKKLTRRLAWRADDTASMGMEPNAVRQAYGNEFSKGAYYANQGKLFQYASQQQYGERVADAFATIWMLKLGGNMQAVDILMERRSKMKPDEPHYTVPVFDMVKSSQRDWERLKRIDAIWSLARTIQQNVGVTQEAIASKPREIQIRDAIEEEKEKEKIVAWVVTSRGPTPVNSEGDVVDIKKKNTKLHQGPRNFNNLKRFGR